MSRWPPLDENRFPDTTHAIERHLRGRKTGAMYQAVRRSKLGMPPILRFLIQNPEVAEALASDARKLSSEERRALAETEATPCEN